MAEGTLIHVAATQKGDDIFFLKTYDLKDYIFTGL